MLSRVANSICWMARYMERTNGMLRLLRTSYIASQNETRPLGWTPVLNLYSDVNPTQHEIIFRDSSKVLQHVMFDANNVLSVCNNIYRARENARAVQDNITREVWQCLNEYHHLIRDQKLQQEIMYGDPVSAMDQLIQHGMTYYGAVDTTLARGEGFNFLNIGKYLERAILSTDMLSIKLKEYIKGKPDDGAEWRYLLYTLSGYELYLKTYRGKFTESYVIDQVVYNTDFSHSLLYCLMEIDRYFEKLKSTGIPENYNEVEFIIGKTMNNVKYSNVDNVPVPDLLQFLFVTRGQLFEISDSINKYYFGNN